MLLSAADIGAGKTGVAEMVGDLLTEAGVRNAVIDVDVRSGWGSRLVREQDRASNERSPGVLRLPGLAHDRPRYTD
jgi:adenylylsulfate kinase-like enzyme